MVTDYKVCYVFRCYSLTFSHFHQFSKQGDHVDELTTHFYYRCDKKQMVDHFTQHKQFSRHVVNHNNHCDWCRWNISHFDQQ